MQEPHSVFLVTLFYLIRFSCVLPVKVLFLQMSVAVVFRMV
ncbi:hypothetical protein HMPREF9441_03102 [Paraprevotella clara YIT 11840]|uniref:Uncharacterized protein n=1 Tax=Paraprevotella clara YIT 11840 TaxID=762968 RepID=G5SUP1_9BACT|nr:hypothetical protein HMPREF9441_03102 [Paraprevotella clara YIT 11840]